MTIILFQSFQQNAGPTQPLLLVLGNKIDNASARKIPTVSGQQLAKSVGACFGEVSAKTGEGIEEVSHCYCDKKHDIVM